MPCAKDGHGSSGSSEICDKKAEAAAATAALHAAGVGDGGVLDHHTSAAASVKSMVVTLGEVKEAVQAVAAVLIARGHARPADDKTTPLPAPRRTKPAGRRKPTLKNPEPDNGDHKE